MRRMLSGGFWTVSEQQERHSEFRQQQGTVQETWQETWHDGNGSQTAVNRPTAAAEHNYTAVLRGQGFRSSNSSNFSDNVQEWYRVQKQLKDNSHAAQEAD